MVVLPKYSNVAVQEDAAKIVLERVVSSRNCYVIVFQLINEYKRRVYRRESDLLLF